MEFVVNSELPSAQFFGTPYAIMWMVGVPSAPGRCRVLYWFFTPSKGAPGRLAKQAVEPAWKVLALHHYVINGPSTWLVHAASQGRLLQPGFVDVVSCITEMGWRAAGQGCHLC